MGTCWVCGDEYEDLSEFEADGFHAACVVKAARINDGLRPKRYQPVSQYDAWHAAGVPW